MNKKNKIIIVNKVKKTNQSEDNLESILFLPKRDERIGGCEHRAQGCFKKAYSDSPLISIVTVVFNGESFLEGTIQGVINQSYDNVEYIVIDGGSTDRTIDIIKKYEDRVDYWVSEPDGGIYDAMNKGIKVSSGVWVNFMNSGDVFADDGALERMDLSLYDGYALVYGNTIQDDKISSHALKIKTLERGEMMACHQSMFFNQNILKEELKYYAHYKIGGDYELVNRIYLGYKDLIKYVNITVAIFQSDGVGSKVSWQARKE